MKAARVLIILVTVAAMLFVWPIHPFREVTSDRSGDEGHVMGRPLQVGESIVQYFRMPADNIIQLEFVLSVEEDQPRNGELLFEFMDEDGKVLYEETLDYAQVPDYSYSGVVLNLRTRWGGMYAYRLTNLSITENQPGGLYTAQKDMRLLRKGTLDYAGERLDGELLTRLRINSPISAENTLAIWGCIAMIGFGCRELLLRWKRN